jgi:hypothetical protein
MSAAVDPACRCRRACPPAAGGGAGGGDTHAGRRELSDDEPAGECVMLFRALLNPMTKAACFHSKCMSQSTPLQRSLRFYCACAACRKPEQPPATPCGSGLPAAGLLTLARLLQHFFNNTPAATCSISVLPAGSPGSPLLPLVAGAHQQRAADTWAPPVVLHALAPADPAVEQGG